MVIEDIFHYKKKIEYDKLSNIEKLLNIDNKKLKMKIALYLIILTLIF